MSLPVKMSIVLLGGITLITYGLFFQARTVLLEEDFALERQEALEALGRATQLLQSEIDHLHRLCLDWSAWDETYDYVDHPDAAYLERNLTPDVFSNLRLNLILILDHNDTVVLERSWDLQTQQPTTIPPARLTALRQEVGQWPLHTPGNYFNGLVQLPGGAMLLAAHPITTSDLSGPINGILVMGRNVTADEVGRLATTLRQPLQLRPNQAHDGAGDQWLERQDAKTLNAVAQLRDINGYPLSQLVLQQPRTLYQQGRQTIRVLSTRGLLLTAGGTLLTWLLLLWLLRLREKQLQSRLRYQALVNNLQQGVVYISSDHRVVVANAQAGAFLPCSGGGELGALCYSRLPGQDGPCVRCPGSRALLTGQPQSLEFSGGTDDDRWMVKAQAVPMATPTGKSPLGFTIVLEDLLPGWEIQQALERLSNYDSLTGLPNRRHFQRRVEAALAEVSGSHQRVALLTLDLDNFKDINDTLGHTWGDLLLVHVCARLLQCCPKEAVLARLGGDEYAILLPTVDAVEAVTDLAEAVLHKLQPGFDLEGHRLFTSCSIGIAVSPHDGMDAAALLQHADMAMYEAKKIGRSNFHFYSEYLHMRASERKQLEEGLHRALERGELFLVYQPQIDLLTSRVVGLEALVRWRHPEQGLIAPARFIPVAETCGLIHEIGLWVLETACRQGRLWQRRLQGWQLAVNLSGSQFRQTGLLDRIDEILRQTGFPAHSLELELTETVLMENAAHTAHLLAGMKERGILLSVDDFGSGYSSLNYLKSFPVDRLKIDQSFVRNISEDANDAAIVTTIIAMARSLGLEVLAEGVETPQQVAFLLARQCRTAQGYYFSRPLSVDQVDQLIDGGYLQEGVGLYTPPAQPPAPPPISAVPAPLPSALRAGHGGLS